MCPTLFDVVAAYETFTKAESQMQGEIGPAAKSNS